MDEYSQPLHNEIIVVALRAREVHHATLQYASRGHAQAGGHDHEPLADRPVRRRAILRYWLLVFEVMLDAMARAEHDAAESYSQNGPHRPWCLRDVLSDRT